jgi:steroid 5-alpha reductase family enzyme
VGLIGAVVMTVLLRKVSGVTLLEKSLVKRRAGYEEYVARTSPFVPRPPKPADGLRQSVPGRRSTSAWTSPL